MSSAVAALRTVDAALKASFTYDQTARNAALMRLAIIDSGSESQFDTITSAAKSICNSAAALITFVDDTRCYFKSNIGKFEGTDGVPRTISVCDHVVHAPDVIVIGPLAPDCCCPARAADGAHLACLMLCPLLAAQTI